MKEQKTNAIAVLISDIHYNLQTLPLADKVMRMAIDKANSLGVPLIVAGDLHDTKANLRAECVNAMIETFGRINTECFIMVGNHDLTNEKASTNSLEFLDGLNDRINIIRTQMRPVYTGVECIAYHSDLNELKNKLRNLPKLFQPNHKVIAILHQGLSGTNSGEDIPDKTALAPEDVAGMRVISGHYHARQTIKLPKGGQWDYIGNPYTLTFGEANDPEKGFQVLNDDGTLTFVPTNLRKHVILELMVDAKGCHCDKPKAIEIDDLVQVKVSGPKEFVQRIDKNYVKKNWVPEANFKLDLIPTTMTSAPVKKERNVAQLLDAVIDGLTDVTPERKIILKDLWKGL